MMAQKFGRRMADLGYFEMKRIQRAPGATRVAPSFTCKQRVWLSGPPANSSAEVRDGEDEGWGGGGGGGGGEGGGTVRQPTQERRFRRRVGGAGDGKTGKGLTEAALVWLTVTQNEVGREM